MTATVADHYRAAGLLDRILAALRQAGKDLDRLTIDDLAPIDEFHSRRRRATEELAALLAPAATDRVIDIGSGLGGPARYLARTFGCRVSGIDLTEDFVAAATGLTALVGLSAQVDFRVGSGLALPFPDASFDLAWTQNVAMNIADRTAWYQEIRRVLKPGGRLALQDVALASGAPLTFPVMWADRPEISFLRTPEETRSLLEAAGFTVLHWIDTSAAALAEAAAERVRLAAQAEPRPILGLHVVVGPSFGEKMRNGGQAQADGRTRLINAVLRRDS
jgi:SAM-dependent methyltransferase